MPAPFADDLLNWYDRHQRDLPWRSKTPIPWHVLVSEFMLQQTQVATVVPYFRRFIERFKTPRDLAGADEKVVLKYWENLGYYRRAKNLHSAAKVIVATHAGEVPADLADLLALPGVGRYTAGAVASLAFGVRAPILDGNVTRVLCRLDKITADPRDPAVVKRLWQRAEEILPDERVGDFNTALMELGATICTPRSPSCLVCPIRNWCGAQSAGLQDQIPPPKKAPATPLVERDVWCARDGAGRYAIERRPAAGRWAGLWQFHTLPRGAPPPPGLTGGRLLGEIRHALTHRRYHFRAFHAAGDLGQTRATLDELADYPLPKPHLRIAAMLRKLPKNAA